MTSIYKITFVATVGAAAAVAAGCGSSPSNVAAGSNKGPGAQAFAYARCMRTHGVRDFPDPHVTTTPGSVRIAMMAPQSAVSSPAFKGAQRACRGILPGPGGGPSRDQGPKKQTLLAFAHCLRTHGEPDFPDPNVQGQLSLDTVRAAGVDVHAPAFTRAARACIRVTHGQITMAMVAAAVNHQ